jgi:hypothetical protein
MSLLEKAIRGTVVNVAPPRTSLFTRALAARAPAPRAEPSEPAEPPFPSEGFGALERELAALPPCDDSILAAWCLVQRYLPLAALALFLPKEGFLGLAARNGFPSGGEELLPLSLAAPNRGGLSELGQEAKALLCPVLGLPLTESLRAVPMDKGEGTLGLWVIHDPSLDAAGPEPQARLASLLAHAADSLPAASIPSGVPDPAKSLLSSARRYPFASIFAFSLPPALVGPESAFKGLSLEALRSAPLSAAGRILSQGGSAVAYGRGSFGCVLGSSSAVDSELTLFQFTKTLKRILPRLAEAGFPEGRSMGLDPSSASALADLSRFLAE